MQLKHLRHLVLVVVSAGVALMWALPAFAQPSKAASTITVTAGKPSELGFTVSPKSVAHGAVTFKVTNKGVLPHDFKICASNKGTMTPNTCTGKVTKMLSAGASATLTVTLAKAGKYEYLCTVPGHAAGGMKGVLTVK